MIKCLSTLLVLGLGFSANADSWIVGDGQFKEVQVSQATVDVQQLSSEDPIRRVEKLLKNQTSSKVSLNGLNEEIFNVVDLTGKNCILGSSDPKIYENAHMILVSKKKDGSAIWQLGGLKQSEKRHCKNGTEFLINRKGQFLPSDFERNKVPKVVAEYAKHSCIMEDRSGSKRNLTEVEASAIAECFFTTTDNQFWAYYKKFTNTSSEYFGTAKGMVKHCTEELKIDNKSPGTWKCTEVFLNMAIDSRQAIIGTIKNNLCSYELTGLGANADKDVICPYGVNASITINGHSSAYFSQGSCKNNSSHCRKVESFLLEKEVVSSRSTNQKNTK